MSDDGSLIAAGLGLSLNFPAIDAASTRSNIVVPLSDKKAKAAPADWQTPYIFVVAL